MTDSKKPTPPGSGGGNCPPGGATPCPETITVTLITPGGDPVRSPNSTQGAQGQNEFTYSTANPGVLTINLKAKVEPSGKAASMVSKVLFEVDSVGNSTMAWNAANPGGKPTVNGDFLEAVVTFTNLPLLNSDFGTKNARLKVDGSVTQTQPYEVFFPRDASNHPGGQAGSPNWFYYWGQVQVIGTKNYGGASGGSTMAKVRGMTNWSYTSVPDKTTLHIFDEVVTKTRAYGVGNEVSGIDNFISTLYHENQHVTQIGNADGLVPSVRCWQYGWSWNVNPHNHWAAGPDGLWGPSPGMATNAVAQVPPFEPGGGDDVNLSDARWANWPASWTWPAPLLIPSPVETDAVRVADNNVSEDDYADQDWADPGKNHKTLLKWDD